MKIIPNFEPNHVELTLERASHPINVEKLAALYVEHLRTLDYQGLKNFINQKMSKKIIDPQKFIVDMLPIANLNEKIKYMSGYKHIIRLVKPKHEMPSSDEIFLKNFKKENFNQQLFFEKSIKSLLPLIREPAINVITNSTYVPAFGISGTPGFIDRNNPFFKKAPVGLEDLIIEKRTLNNIIQ